MNGNRTFVEFQHLQSENVTRLAKEVDRLRRVNSKIDGVSEGKVGNTNNKKPSDGILSKMEISLEELSGYLTDLNAELSRLSSLIDNGEFSDEE